MTKQVSQQPEAAETVDGVQPAGEQSADRSKNNSTTVTKWEIDMLESKKTC